MSHGRPYLSRTPSPYEEDEEEDHDDDYGVIKEEADEAMADATPPGAGNLPPQYQAVLADGYDEQALLQQVLEASKADEDHTLLDLQEALALTGMVAEHLASLPPPPPLPPHAPLLTAYEGQEVPPLPGVPRCRRQHDHPHRVAINPPQQPQPEVVVDLVFDDEE
jgi:hypothetical protein